MSVSSGAGSSLSSERSVALSGAELLGGFERHLREERGLAELTVVAYVSAAGRFLGRCGGGVGDLTAGQVSRAVLEELPGHGSSSVQLFAHALRAFLRYCDASGVVERDLSSAVLPVSGPRRSLLPTGLSDEQVRVLLGSCDRRRAAGRRDYAAILLMLRLGLRACEVAALRLDDIDWRTGVVTVHGKGGRVDRLPLPVDAGEAIAGYLRRGRPRSQAREVFLSLAPPHAPISRCGVSTLVRHASSKAGLPVFGSHRLRHTVACNMLRAGVSLTGIGQVLRQDSVRATALYARVDVERLRTVARPWPEEAVS